MTNNDPAINSYLSFKLGKEIYAVHVSSTLKILQLSEITNVPNAPASMKGVINHHGNVLPVIDLNQTFGLPETQKTYNTCIIILSVLQNNEQQNIGAIVDEVLSVEKITQEQISEPPSLGTIKLEHIGGVTKKNDDFIMILDIDNIFKELNFEQ